MEKKRKAHGEDFIRESIAANSLNITEEMPLRSWNIFRGMDTLKLKKTLLQKIEVIESRRQRRKASLKERK